MKILLVLILCTSIFIYADSKNSFFQIRKIEQEESHKLSQKHIGQNFIWEGKIQKIGKQFHFMRIQYNGDNFNINRYYVTNDLKKEFELPWVKISGKYKKIIKQRVEIEILECQSLFANSEQLEKATKESHKWVAENLPKYDLNTYKKTTRFQLALSHLQDKDLNKSPYTQRKNSDILYVDHDRKIIAIGCGKSTLYKSFIRGDFLSYYAVYDLGKKKLLKVFMENTGYFLE